MPLEELQPHLHSLPDQPPSSVPHPLLRAENWGFCLAQSTLDGTAVWRLRGRIDSTLEDGWLTYAEHAGRGRTRTRPSCLPRVHPSLANDNMAGMAVAAQLAQALRGTTTRTVSSSLPARSVRSPGSPATKRFREGQARHHAGLAATRSLTYKQSRRGDAEIDRVLAHVLPHPPSARVLDSSVRLRRAPVCSPGYNLGVGSLTRTPYAGYPEYHTSATTRTSLPRSPWRKHSRCAGRPSTSSTPTGTTST